MFRCFMLLTFAFASTSSASLSAADLAPIDNVELEGSVRGAGDLSAIDFASTMMIIGSDEADGTNENENYIQFLKKRATNKYEVISTRDLNLTPNAPNDKTELDIEAIAVSDTAIYVAGSHAARRKKLKKKDYLKNRKRLRFAGRNEENRDRLHRIPIDASGNIGQPTNINLQSLFERHEILGGFAHLPGKENGINIEALAWSGGHLYIGFRAPVFRKGYVPVLRFDFDNPQPAALDLMFVNLKGLGLRSITRAPGGKGFLILAGQSTERIKTTPHNNDDQFELYLWDGRDIVPGTKNRPDTIGTLLHVGTIKPPETGAKAEGLAVVPNAHRSGAQDHEIIVTYDSATSVRAQRFQIKLPK